MSEGKSQIKAADIWCLRTCFHRHAHHSPSGTWGKCSLALLSGLGSCSWEFHLLTSPHSKFSALILTPLETGFQYTNGGVKLAVLNFRSEGMKENEARRKAVHLCVPVMVLEWRYSSFHSKPVMKLWLFSFGRVGTWEGHTTGSYGFLRKLSSSEWWLCFWNSISLLQ